MNTRENNRATHHTWTHMKVTEKIAPRMNTRENHRKNRAIQLAIDTTLVSPLTSEPRSRARHYAGAAVQDARRATERTYPELLQTRRCKLVVLAIEVGGRWSQEATTFLRIWNDFGDVSRWHQSSSAWRRRCLAKLRCWSDLVPGWKSKKPIDTANKRDHVPRWIPNHPSPAQGLIHQCLDPPVVCPNHPCSYQSPGIWLRRERRHRRQPTSYQWGAGRSHPPPSRQPRPTLALRSSGFDLALFPCTSGAAGIWMAHDWKLPSKTAPTRPYARKKVRRKKKHEHT